MRTISYVGLDVGSKRCSHQALMQTHHAVHARLTTQRKILAVLRTLWKGGAIYQDDKA